MFYFFCFDFFAYVSINVCSYGFALCHIRSHNSVLAVQNEEDGKHNCKQIKQNSSFVSMENIIS